MRSYSIKGTCSAGRCFVLLLALACLEVAVGSEARSEFRFSDNVGVKEIFSKRVTPEGVFPLGGEPSDEETKALAGALAVIPNEGQIAGIDALQHFLQEYPDSKWRVTVSANVGLMQRKTGRFSDALETFETVWKEGRNLKSWEGRGIVDVALGQLAELYAKLGRRDALAGLLEETRERTIMGSAKAQVDGAKEGLWMMTNRPQKAFLCGPEALKSLYKVLNPGLSIPEVLLNAQSSSEGTSMDELIRWAEASGMELSAVERVGDGDYAVPSVVHWKAGHFAAIVEMAGDQFRIVDPTFGEQYWISRDGIEEESSGFFIFETSKLNANWEVVDHEEMRTIRGKGYAANGDPSATRPYDLKVGGNDCAEVGMPGYSVHALLVSLNVVDTPVAYSPPRGLPLIFTMTYNEREANQVQFPVHSNLGLQWTFNWSSRIEKAAVGDNLVHFLPGGGSETFVYDYGTSTYFPLPRTRAELTVIGTRQYRISYPDGSIQEYTQLIPDLITTFITKVADPQGNALIFNYESGTSAKLTSVESVPNGDSSAIAEATLHYTHDSANAACGEVPINDPADFLVTGVTISVNGGGIGKTRTAAVEYDCAFRLARVTDSMSLVSGFQYEESPTGQQSTSLTITSLTTPYGTSTFSRLRPKGFESYTDDKWLTITDPEGGREMFVYKGEAGGGFAKEVPLENVEALNDEMFIKLPGHEGQWLQYRNTFHWTKQAIAKLKRNIEYLADGEVPEPDHGGTSPLKYSDARVMHWLHLAGGVAAGTLESIKEPLEGRVWFEYAGQSNSPDAVHTSASYLPPGDDAILSPIRVGRVLGDGTAQVSESAYNSLGRPTKIVEPRYFDATGATPIDVNRTTEIEYAANDIDLIAVRQRVNSTETELLATFSYYSGQKKHLVHKATDIAGRTTTYEYNDYGQTTSVTDPLGRETVFEYDTTTGFLEKVIVPDVTGAGLSLAERTLTFEPDDMLRVESTTDGHGYTISYVYDEFDRVTRVSYPDGSYEETVYDRLDPVMQRDRQGKWSVTQYDSMRRPVAHKDPLGRITQFDWCSCGSLSGIVDPLGRVTSWDRDVQGRVVKKYFPDGSTQSFEYESRLSAGNVEGISSRLTKITDAKGQVKSIEYFTDNSVKAVSYQNTSVQTPGVRFRYDPVYSRLLAMSDGTGTTTYEYYPVEDLSSPPTTGELDAAINAGRIHKIIGPQNDNSTSFYNDNLVFEYDDLGRMDEVYFGEGDSPTGDKHYHATYSYDELGRLESMTDNLGTFDYSYVDATSYIDEVAYPNGQIVDYDYHGISAPTNPHHFQLKTIWNKADGGATLSKFDYGYVNDGSLVDSKIESWVREEKTGGTTVTSNYQFSYDVVNQLVGAVLRQGATTAGTEIQRREYNYDLLGNRTRQHGTGAGGGNQTAGFNSLNQMTAASGSERRTITANIGDDTAISRVAFNGVTIPEGSPSGTYSAAVTVSEDSPFVEIRAYDTTGNSETNVFEMLNLSASSQEIAHRYDLNGNLVQAYLGTSGDDYILYSWDAENRLAGIDQVDSGDIEHRTRFRYDGLGRRTYQLEYDENDALIGRTRFLWVGSRIVEEINLLSGSKKKIHLANGVREYTTFSAYTDHYFTRDHLGSIREVVDEDGATLEARYDYDVYGTRSQTLPSPTYDVDHGFTGHYLHQPSGLYLTYYRAYDPELGRWLSRDPLMESAGLNLYAYVFNDPVNMYDPLGLLTASDVGGYLGGKIDAGTESLSIDSGGALAFIGNTVIYAAGGLLGAGADALMLGDSAGNLSADPCANWKDWAAVGLEEVGRAGTIVGGVGKAAGTLGRAAKTGVPRITDKGIQRIEGHLGNLGALDDGANQAMLGRLRAGQTSPQDINFYMHELKESARMKAGLDYNAAHQATLQWQGIPYNAASPAQLYHPDVIRQFSDSFNKAAWPK